MKICHFCGNNNFRETTIQYTYKHNNQYFIVDDVPCTQCEFCGETYFEAKDLKQIEAEFNALYQHGKQPTRKLYVPIERFSDFRQL